MNLTPQDIQSVKDLSEKINNLCRGKNAGIAMMAALTVAISASKEAQVPTEALHQLIDGISATLGA